MATPLKTSESGNILKLELFSRKVSGSRDVSPGVIVCDYRESILEPTVRFTIIIVDTGNTNGGGKSSITVIQELKLSGSEKVHMTIEDRQGNRLKFEGDNALYISEIRNIISSSEKTIYTLDLVSRECIANELLACEVYRRFDGKVSEAAGAIFKDALKTKKNLAIDETINKYNFIGQGKQPFRLLAEIATKGVPASANNTAGYLVFETYNGYNFRSIDSLFNEKPVKSFIYNSTTKLPSGYDAKIVKYDADNSMNVEKTLKSGGYGSKLETFNTYTHLFNPKAQEIDTEEQKVHGGTEVPKLHKDFEQYAQGGAVLSRRFAKLDSVGELPEGSVSQQIAKATEPNLNLEEVICQSPMTYNKLFSLDMTVVIPGDYSLRAGQLVHCDFPEQSSKENTGNDKELSGVYMISDICTHLTSKTTLTKMRLVRDSHGRTANKTAATSAASANTTASKNTGVFGNTPLNPLSLNSLIGAITEDTGLADVWNNPRYSGTTTPEDGGRIIDRTLQTSDPGITGNINSSASVNLDPSYDDPDFNPEDYLQLD
jgi:hypothetical protein